MSLADRVNEEPSKRKQCVACMWLDTLSNEDRKAFDELATRSDISKEQLGRICMEEGFPATVSAVKRHLEHHVPC
jgi:hypothetical protein